MITRFEFACNAAEYIFLFNAAYFDID